METKLLKGAGASWGRKCFMKKFRVWYKQITSAIGPENKRGVVLPARQMAPVSVLNHAPGWVWPGEGKRCVGRERDVTLSLESLWDPQPVDTRRSRQWRPVASEVWRRVAAAGMEHIKHLVGTPKYLRCGRGLEVTFTRSEYSGEKVAGEGCSLWDASFDLMWPHLYWWAMKTWIFVCAGYYPILLFPQSPNPVSSICITPKAPFSFSTPVHPASA